MNPRRRPTAPKYSGVKNARTTCVSGSKSCRRCSTARCRHQRAEEREVEPDELHCSCRDEGQGHDQPTPRLLCRTLRSSQPPRRVPGAGQSERHPECAEQPDERLPQWPRLSPSGRKGGDHRGEPSQPNTSSITAEDDDPADLSADQPEVVSVRAMTAAPKSTTPRRQCTGWPA